MSVAESHQMIRIEVEVFPDRASVSRLFPKPSPIFTVPRTETETMVRLLIEEIEKSEVP